MSEALLQAMAALFGEAAKVGIFAREVQGETVLRQYSAPSTMNSALAQWFDFLDEVRAVGMPRSRTIGGCHCGALMLEPSELTAEHLRLSGRARGAADPQALADEAADVLGMLLIYCDRAGIDLEQAMQAKWLHWLEPKA